MMPEVRSAQSRSRVTTTLRQLDWLWLFLASWVLPLAVAIFRPLTYWNSLLFWLVPTLLLLPRFLEYTDPGGRRRTALLVSSANIIWLGIVLDFVLGSWVLRFDELHPDSYLFWITAPALRVNIPVEELFFYTMSPIAILLVYSWADEYWMALYSARRARAAIKANDPLFQFSPINLAIGLAVLAATIILHRRLQPATPFLPIYFTFLIVMGLAPAVVLFRTVARFVNWRAFAITTLYLLVTSIIWEGGLAIPRHWWGYQTRAMIGVWADPWTIDPTWPLPIEAVLVWLAAPFSCVLLYEGTRFIYYRRNPAKPAYEHPSVAAARAEMAPTRSFTDLTAT